MKLSILCSVVVITAMAATVGFAIQRRAGAGAEASTDKSVEALCSRRQRR